MQRLDSLAGKYYRPAMSDAVETPSKTVEAVNVPPGFHTRFTPERAKAVRLEAIARHHALLNPPPIQPATVPLDPFTEKQRDIIRARMERLTDKLDTEEDPSKLDRLAAAWSKLAEQERILDGRPLPGSRRPREERRAPRPSLPEPE